MKHILLFIFTITLFSTTNSQKRKAIFVIVDGIPADVIEKLSTPNLDAIAGKNGYAHTLVGGEKNTHTQTPTISAVGYNTVLTGTWVHKHNVWDNDIAAPNYNYPTIFRLFKNQYPAKTTAVFSTWLDNRTKLIGEGLAETGSIKMDFSFDGLELDTVMYPHDKNSAYIHAIDKAVVNKAAASIRENAPDLSWVYLQYTDDMAHRYGDSEPFYAAVLEMDKQMGELWSAINYRQKEYNENWQIYITTDHGRDSATGKHHGGQSLREKTGWIVTNAPDVNERFSQGKSALTDIMPSIARFLSVKIPLSRLREVDGVSITGPLDISDAQIKKEGNFIRVSWTPYRKKGTLKIYVSNTNNVKNGGIDEYTLVKKVKIKKGFYLMPLSNLPVSQKGTNTYKIILETKRNTLNGWYVPHTQ